MDCKKRGIERPHVFKMKRQSTAPETKFKTYTGETVNFKDPNIVKIRTDTYRPINSKKWDPTRTRLELHDPSVTGLMDRTHTPRGYKKEMTLARNWDQYPWMHTRRNMEAFENVSQIKADKEKNKILKRHARMRKRAGVSQSMNITGYSSIVNKSVHSERH